MEKDTESKKKVNRIALAVLGVALMFFNLGLTKVMANEPFSAFVFMAFLTNMIIALGFVSVYRKITRKDGK